VRAASLLDSPFADITLTLEAVLSEMRVPLSSIAALAPGQTLPIPVARAVPLRVGGTIVARGTVGELDDRVALQITNATPSRKDIQ
jgi:flagellar motor switch protein FliM